MNKNFFFVLVLISDIDALILPDYVYLCNPYYEFVEECNTYQFNQKTCFPWNTFNCSIIKTEYNNYCLIYDCTVKMIQSSCFLRIIVLSNLCTTTTLGTLVAVVDRWLLFIGTFILKKLKMGS